MKGRFIAKAFVKCKDENNRNYIKSALLEIGITRKVDSLHSRAMYFVINHESYKQLNKYRLNLLSICDGESDTIDCNDYAPNGTEEEAVKLFLELAKMRADTVVGQWVEHTNRVQTVFDEKPFKAQTEWGHHLCYKLTSLELAEAYKAGRIAL